MQSLPDSQVVTSLKTVCGQENVNLDNCWCAECDGREGLALSSALECRLVVSVVSVSARVDTDRLRPGPPACSQARLSASWAPRDSKLCFMWELIKFLHENFIRNFYQNFFFRSRFIKNLINELQERPHLNRC